MKYQHVQATDPEIYALMADELHRQQSHLELIASENFVSEAVMEAMGSHLTNKYAEGLPGACYYGGCCHVDDVERIAIARAKTLFGADHANVQPHLGAQANTAVYFAMLNPGDTVLGMSLITAVISPMAARSTFQENTSTSSPMVWTRSPKPSIMPRLGTISRNIGRSWWSWGPPPIPGPSTSNALQNSAGMAMP